MNFVIKETPIIQVVRTKWDSRSSLWTVETQTGEKLKCDVLVSGVGFLHVPKMPDIPGLEDFEVGVAGDGFFLVYVSTQKSWFKFPH